MNVVNKLLLNRKELWHNDWFDRFAKCERDEHGNVDWLNADDLDIEDLNKNDIIEDLLNSVVGNKEAEKELRVLGVDTEEALEEGGEIIFNKFKEVF